MRPRWLPVTLNRMRDALLDLLAYIRVYGRAAAIVAFLLLVAWTIFRPIFQVPDI